MAEAALLELFAVPLNRRPTLRNAASKRRPQESGSGSRLVQARNSPVGARCGSLGVKQAVLRPGKDRLACDVCSCPWQKPPSPDEGHLLAPQGARSGARQKQRGGRAERLCLGQQTLKEKNYQVRCVS